MRLYRLLLHLYPASFRDEYGEELRRVLSRQRRDTTGLIPVCGLWISTVADTLVTALRVHLDILWQDLRHTSRTLRRTPGFTATAVLVTALGVGATTAAFTLTDYVLVRPLPFPDADRLVKIWEGQTTGPTIRRGLQGTNEAGPANYLDWKDMSRSFSVMGAYAFVSSNYIGAGDPERIEGVVVSADAMTTVGVAPAIGRALTPQDDTSGAACAVLVSDAFWRSRFGGNPSVQGTRITLDREICEVAGVMPRGFEFPTRTTSFWRPIRFRPDVKDDREDHYLKVIARLKPGVSLEQARDDLDRVSATLRTMYPKDNADVATVVIRLRDELNDQSRMLLLVIAGAAACLLLLACTNLASLVIARATARVRELAVRTAMGAGRSRLVRQLLTESVLLAAVGGGLGLLLAAAAVPTAARLVPTTLPVPQVPGLDLRMLAIAAIVTLGTGIGFGVLPALRATRQAAGNNLRDSSRVGSSRRTERVRAGLVVAQVTVSIVLMVGAGLMLRTLLQVQATPTGFNPERVLTMRTTLPWSKYALQAPRVEFIQRVLTGVKGLPGVTTAAYTSFLPMTMRGGVWDVVVPARPASRNDPASSRFVTPDYFRVMEIPLKRGRTFEESDTLKSQPVAIVSESFVLKYLEGQEAIGRTFTFSLAGDRTIVGVAGNIRVRGLERPSEPQVYLPYQQQPDNQTLNYVPKDLVVKVDAGVEDSPRWDALVASIRRVVASVDSQQPVADVQPLSAIVLGETAARSVQLRVIGAFAAVSCLLAAVGLHGLLAFVVSARTREFGVRLALGAEPRQILSLVARRGVTLGLAGVTIGVAIAYAAGRWIESLLVGVSPADSLTLSAAVAVSLTMSLAGSLLPAFRASRTNPTAAIQAE